MQRRHIGKCYIVFCGSNHEFRESGLQQYFATCTPFTAVRLVDGILPWSHAVLADCVLSLGWSLQFIPSCGNRPFHSYVCNCTGFR